MATAPLPAIGDGSVMRRGGRYLITFTGRGGMLDVWCGEVTERGFVRVKRRDKVHEWHRASQVVVLEVLDDPPPPLATSAKATEPDADDDEPAIGDQPR